LTAGISDFSVVAVAKPFFERFNPFLRDFVEMDPYGSIVVPSVIAGAISGLSEISDGPKVLLLGYMERFVLVCSKGGS